MRALLKLLVVLAATGSLACSGRSPGAEPTGSDAASQPAAPSTQGRLLAPPPLPPSDPGRDPLACGFEPPPILSPADGAVLSRQVTISSPLVEGPCNISATIVFSVADARGMLVRRGCDNDLPAHITWDTRLVPNGPYWITAQRACSCNPCAEYSWIQVTVANQP